MGYTGYVKCDTDETTMTPPNLLIGSLLLASILMYFGLTSASWVWWVVAGVPALLLAIFVFGGFWVAAIGWFIGATQRRNR